MAEFDPIPLLDVLRRHGVQFIVVGGIAAIAQGSPLPTEDLDVTPARDAPNLRRLAAALRELDAGLRIGRGGEPIEFPIDARFLADSESWTLTTRYGSLDIVGVPAGTQGYEDLDRDASEADFGDGILIRIASLRDVIRMKEAAGRPKDLAQLPALRQTLDRVRERQRRGEPT